MLRRIRYFVKKRKRFVYLLSQHEAENNAYSSSTNWYNRFLRRVAKSERPRYAHLMVVLVIVLAK